MLCAQEYFHNLYFHVVLIRTLCHFRRSCAGARLFAKRYCLLGCLLIRDIIFRVLTKRYYLQGAYQEILYSVCLSRDIIFRVLIKRYFLQGACQEILSSRCLPRDITFRVLAKRYYLQSAYQKILPRSIAIRLPTNLNYYLVLCQNMQTKPSEIACHSRLLFIEYLGF